MMAASGFTSVQRLNNRRQFDAVFKQATLRASCPEFTGLAVENGLDISRLGMVVSKKVAGNSVNRNRIRRLIRESFRQGFNRNGLDVVILARPSVKQIENAVMLRILDSLWERLSGTSVKPGQGI